MEQELKNIQKKEEIIAVSIGIVMFVVFSPVLFLFGVAQLIIPLILLFGFLASGSITIAVLATRGFRFTKDVSGLNLRVSIRGNERILRRIQTFILNPKNENSSFERVGEVIFVFDKKPVVKVFSEKMLFKILEEEHAEIVLHENDKMPIFEIQGKKDSLQEFKKFFEEMIQLKLATQN